MLIEEGIAVHRLMESVESIDCEVGLPFARLFLMTHGHWVDPDIAEAIANGFRAGRVRLPDRNVAILRTATDAWLT